MAIYFFNIFYIYILITRNFLLLNKLYEAKYFIFHYYAKTVFQNIISDINAIKIFIVEKINSKSCKVKCQKLSYTQLM